MILRGAIEIHLYNRDFVNQSVKGAIDKYLYKAMADGKQTREGRNEKVFDFLRIF